MQECIRGEGDRLKSGGKETQVTLNAAAGERRVAQAAELPEKNW